MDTPVKPPETRNCKGEARGEVHAILSTLIPSPFLFLPHNFMGATRKDRPTDPRSSEPQHKNPTTSDKADEL